MNILPFFVRSEYLDRRKTNADWLATGSETMSLVQLIVPTEVAHDTVYELGELGNVQFKDVGFLLISSLGLC